MARLYNLVQGIQDVSNNGYYPNQNFKATMACISRSTSKQGWTVTTLASEAEAWIRETFGRG